MTPELHTDRSERPVMSWPAPPAGLALEVEAVHVFAFDLDVPEPAAHRLAQVLSPDERARAARFRYEQHRRRYVVGRAQLRSILARYTREDAVRISFSYGEHGKPALRSSGAGDGIRFNMSRSIAVGVVAVQLDDDVGIDIERVRPFPNGLEIAMKLFTSDEQRVLQSLPAAERDAAFFRYWTRKEAVVKSIGLGLSLRIDTFALSPELPCPTQRVDVPDHHGLVTRWMLPVPDPSEGYVVAIATAGSPRLVRCWTWADP